MNMFHKKASANTKANPFAFVFFMLFAILFSLITVKNAHADCSGSYEVGGRRNIVTQGEIFAAVQEASGDPAFAAAAASLSHNVENSTGDLALSNGCNMLGIFQMSPDNVRVYAKMTREQYAQSDALTQATAWTKFFRAGYRSVAKTIAGLGTTFDGQPVDNAFRIACVQLGTRNCQKMISKNSCSSFGDGNGMSICQMAAKLRRGIGGSTDTSNPGNTIGQNTMTNEDDAVRNPQYAGTGGTTMPLGSLAYCWSCDIIVYALAGTEMLITSALPQMTAVLFPILSAAFAIGLIWNIMQSLALGTSPVAKGIPLIIRFAFVATILSFGGQALSSLILTDTISPIINTAARLGEKLAWGADKALSISLTTAEKEASTSAIPNSADATGYIQLFNITPQQGVGTKTLNNDCIYNASANVRINYLVEAEAATTSLACTIHHVEATVQNIGVIFMSLSASSDITNVGNMAKLAVNGAGMMITATSLLGMLKYGSTVMGVLIEIGTITTFAPYILFCTIFPSTRQIAGTYAKRLLHAALALTISGIAAITGLLCLIQSLFFGASLNPYNTTLDPLLVVNKATSMMTAFSVQHPQTMADAIKFMLYCIAGTTICNTMIDQGSRIAAQITGTKNSEALSSALAVTVSTVLKMVNKNAPMLLAPLAKQGGKLFGALTSGMKDPL